MSHRTPFRSRPENGRCRSAGSPKKSTSRRISRPDTERRPPFSTRSSSVRSHRGVGTAPGGSGQRTNPPNVVTLPLVRRWDLQPFAGGDDGGYGGAAGFGDLAVAVAGAAADLELDEGGAAKFGAVLRRTGGAAARAAWAARSRRQSRQKVPSSELAQLRGQFDLLAAGAADGHPALVAGPFLRGRDAHSRLGRAGGACRTRYPP